MKRYFLSFIEEFWPGQKEGTFIGRCEVHGGDKWPDEIPIGTFDRAAVEALREKYDGTRVDKATLKMVEAEIEKINQRKK